MSADDRHHPTDPDDAALDRLLERARWEEPTAADEYRLREEWVHLRRRRRIMPMVYLAVAASILIVAAMSLMPSSEPAQRIAVKMLMTQDPIEEPPLIESREANSFEMLVMAQATASRPLRKVAVAKNPLPPPMPSPIDPAVRKLVNQLGDPLMTNRYEAARELARTDPPVVVPILAEMVEQGLNRREALAALMMSEDPLAAEALAEVRSSRTVEAQLIALKAEIH